MSYNIDLSGRVALVTGASSGLGAQFARTLSRAGAGVVLDSVPQSEADETRNKARAVLRAIATAHHAQEIF